MLLSRGPASTRHTLTEESSVSRLARTHPADPAPTITKSNSVWLRLMGLVLVRAGSGVRGSSARRGDGRGVAVGRLGRARRDDGLRQRLPALVLRSLQPP